MQATKLESLVYLYKSFHHPITSNNRKSVSTFYLFICFIFCCCKCVVKRFVATSFIFVISAVVLPSFQWLNTKLHAMFFVH